MYLVLKMDQVVTIIEKYETRMHTDLEVFRVVHKLQTLMSHETDGLSECITEFTLTTNTLDEGDGDTSIQLDEVKTYIQHLRKYAERARAIIKRVVDDVLPILQRIDRLLGGETAAVSMLATDEFLMGEENLSQAIETFGRGADELRTCTRIIEAVQTMAHALPGLHYETQKALMSMDRPPRKSPMCVSAVKEFLHEWEALCDARHGLVLQVGEELSATRELLESLCGCVHVNFD